MSEPEKKHPIVGFFGLVIFVIGVLMASCGPFYWYEAIPLLIGLILLVYALFTGQMTLFG